MYSYEIHNILKQCDYAITDSLYIDILLKSPQISYTQRNPDTGKFEIFTDDKFHFEFNVIKGVKEL